jgi:MFS family permease
MLTILFTSSVAFLASVVAPGLPALYADFAHLPNAELLSRLVLTMPMLFVALAGPFVGMVIDRYGRRNTLIVSTIGFGLAGMSGLVLETLMAIIVGRAFLGVFLVGILTSVTALIGDYYSGEERNRIAGLQGAFISFGTLIYTILGGVLAAIHWRASFALFAVAFVLIVPMLLSLYEPSRTPAMDRSKPVEVPPGRREWFVIGWVYVLAFSCLIALFMIPAQTPFFLVDIGVGDPARAGLAVGIFSFSSGFASLAFPWLRRHFSVASIFAMIFIDGDPVADHGGGSRPCAKRPDRGVLSWPVRLAILQPAAGRLGHHWWVFCHNRIRLAGAGRVFYRACILWSGATLAFAAAGLGAAGSAR